MGDPTGFARELYRDSVDVEVINEAAVPFADEFENSDTDITLDAIRELAKRILDNTGFTDNKEAPKSDIELDAIELATLIHQYNGWDI